MLAQATKLRVFCDEKGCQLPVAYLKDGMLIIESRHHGEKHVSTIRVDLLLDKEVTTR